MHFTTDVLSVTDFRLPGGTTHSTAQELAIHKRRGWRTALLHVNSRLSAHPRPWSPAITGLLERGVIEPFPPNASLHAHVALLRHPIVMEALPDVSRRVHAETIILIANQPARRPDGDPEYDVAQVDSLIHKHMGQRPLWAPIGPVVRESLQAFAKEVSILPENWTNVFENAETPAPRSSFRSERPRIGRHSRPQPAKWPTDPKDILAAYPEDPRYDVRILGGAKPASQALGRQPKNWTVHPFGSMEPKEFLKEVDFWVYFHHPNWSEAYGRAIMEALWSGAVVILPEDFKATFGDAAVYASPAQVQTIIDEFRTGTRNYQDQSAAGQRFAQTHGPALHINRMQALLSTEATGAKSMAASEAPESTEGGLAPPAAHLTSHVPRSRFEVDERPRALFVTSNGSGMGHLTRMLGIARAAAAEVCPVFLSLSQGVAAVASAGFAYEYVPFRTALNTTPKLWNPYFEQRLLEAIDHYDARMLVFDGTAPYRSLLDVLGQRELVTAWVRRGMWKSTTTPKHLGSGRHFDLIIEPGDYARDYDQGPTANREDALRVPPITVLEQSEVLSKEAALAELGLPAHPDRPYVLVTLGAGNINDIVGTQTTVLAELKARKRWRPVVTRAPIATSAHQFDALSLKAFPLARYGKAFEFAVSAAGYNTFTEWMAGGLPSIWAPNLATSTDDQLARARWAVDNGYGLLAAEDDEESLSAALAAMDDDSKRGAMRTRLAALPPADGARAAAEALISLLARCREA